MDDEHNAHMQVDLSTNTMSALQAFKMDPSTEWVIESIPGFVAIKHKMGCSICDASASHFTVKNLGDQVQSLEAQLQKIKSNPDELLKHKELILENKHLQQELDYYVGRARYALYGKDANWATRNGYCISDIPLSDSEDDDEDLGGLPMIPEEIPQYVLLCPPVKLARPVGKSNYNDSKVVHEAGIPAIGGSRLPPTPKRIIADPPASITGVLPRPLDWVMESDVHDSEMRRLYIEGRALQPHERSSDHTAVIFHIDEYAKSLPGLSRGLMVRPDDPDWMINVVQTFNANPSGIPRNLRLEGPKFRGAEAEVLLQSIFSTVGKWDQMIAGQWKRNDNPFLCSPTPVRYKIHRNQKFDRKAFTYWLGCEAGTIWNKVTLRSQLRANEITSLKGGLMNQFRVHGDLLPLVQESPYYFPPSMGEPMDQDETDPESNPIQHTSGSSSLADRLDYGEGGSFSHPPADARELQAQISYYDSLVPQGTARESIAKITEALTRDLYMDNHE
ncbi:hypothetical protein M422DRAFT_270141 [Sphaerobolus stellatus SS14]|uniref:Uncharacterized protein n=1 Tax=Sphaerobolus stellatus (strain SS14) TaxID=990650 RepID=A0A0C9U2X5_SPHS4|nr:hypothetical protein M422DRAFT_270141 [Sphaerobolus stellatus SS14]